MASTELSARLRFLNDSAHLLAITASATSKYLMTSRNTLMFDRNIEQSEAQRRNVCGACGTIMVLGWDATMQMESQRRSRKRKRIDQSKDVQNMTKAMVYECESCSRVTRFPIALPKPRNKIRLQRQTPSVGSGGTIPTQAKANPKPDIPLSTNASSKKRAKARKQSGLEAILAKKKSSEASSSGFGLNLMDFMKKA